MKKVVITFGLLSGAVSAGLMTISMLFSDRIGFDRGLVIGYTVIVVSLLFVYFGIRSYRDNVLGGRLSFGRGVMVGLLITVISCLCYVAAWQVLYLNFMPDFAAKYTTYMADNVRAAGGGEAEVAKAMKQGEDLKKLLDDPLMSSAMTFIEPFPVGVLVTLISAAILKKRG